MNLDFDAELDKRVSDEHRHKADEAVKNFAFSGEKLFGVIPVPKEMAKIIAMLVPPLVSYVTKEGAQFADKVRPGAGKYVGVALPLAIYAQPTVADMLAYKKEIGAFNERLHPLFVANKEAKSGMGKLFDSGERPNAIISFARNQKHGRHLNKLFGSAISGGVGFGYQQIVNNKTLVGKIDGVTHNEAIREHFQGFNPQLLVGGLVGSVSDWLKEIVHTALPQAYQGNCSLDMCYNFIEDAQAASGNLDPLDTRDLHRELKEQSRKIIEIFLARYQESGWKEMPPRVQEKLEDIAEMIARPMLMGELSPLAIINLAGENKILQNNGRSVASESEVTAALEEQMGKLSAQKMMKAEDFYVATELKAADIATALKTLGPEEKAFLAVLVPDAVLLKGGASREEIDAFRRDGEKDFSDRAQAIIGILAARPAEELREHFSKTEITMLRDLDRSLTEMTDKPRQRHDDLALMDEKDQLTHNNAVRTLLVKGYMGSEPPAAWRKLLAERHAEKDEEKEAKEACEAATKPKKHTGPAAEEGEGYDAAERDEEAESREERPSGSRRGTSEGRDKSHADEYKNRDARHGTRETSAHGTRDHREKLSHRGESGRDEGYDR